jgi:hypothetical protein
MPRHGPSWSARMTFLSSSTLCTSTASSQPAVADYPMPFPLASDLSPLPHTTWRSLVSSPCRLSPGHARRPPRPDSKRHVVAELGLACFKRLGLPSHSPRHTLPPRQTPNRAPALLPLPFFLDSVTRAPSWAASSGAQAPAPPPTLSV